MKNSIKWFNKKQVLNQIYSSGLEMSMVSENMEQCFPFIRCKDWAHDALRARIYNRKESIYGFSYDPQKMPLIDLEKTRFVFVNSKDPEIENKLDNVLDFLNQIESNLKLERSRGAVINKTPDPKYKKALYIEGSGRWQMAPPMLSLYTLFIRVGFSHTKGNKWEETVKNLIDGKIKPYQIHDTNYLRQAKPAIDKIMILGYRPFFYKELKRNFPENVDIRTLHNYAGIVSMANRATDSICKYWTRKSLDERVRAKIIDHQI